MALTRKMLSAMGIEDEKIDQIVEEHSKVVNAIKEERDKAETKVTELTTANAELKKTAGEAEKFKAELEAIDVEGMEKKYADLKAEYDEYKKGVETKATHDTKEKAYQNLLMEAGVSEKRIPSILKISEVDAIEIDTDGKIKDSDKLIESIKSEWSDFIQTTGIKGAGTAKPPANTGGSAFESMSLNEKMEYANANPDSPEVKAWLGK